MFKKNYKVEDLLVYKTTLPTSFILVSVKEYNKSCKLTHFDWFKAVDGRRIEFVSQERVQPLFYMWDNDMQKVLEKNNGRIGKLEALAIQGLLNRKYS